jgi:hypothetical protein
MEYALSRSVRCDTLYRKAFGEPIGGTPGDKPQSLHLFHNFLTWVSSAGINIQLVACRSTGLDDGRLDEGFRSLA